MLQIDPADSPALQAAILSLKTADKELAGTIRRVTRETLTPEWTTSVQQKATTALERRVLGAGAKATASNQNLAITAATSRKKLSGGLVPADNPWGVEMGSTRQKQFKSRNSRGYVVIPLAKEFAARAVSLWVSTIVRQYLEARDKGQN